MILRCALCSALPPPFRIFLHGLNNLLIHPDFCSLSDLLCQGLTGRPGDAGPQGKVGPSVSAPFCKCNLLSVFLPDSLHCFVITLYFKLGSQPLQLHLFCVAQSL